MQRRQYNLNSSFYTAGNHGELLPLGFHEVVPGDTIDGNVDLTGFFLPMQLTSNSQMLVPLNRMFYDVFTFYVPYRQVWPWQTEDNVDDETTGWVDFITQNQHSSGLKVPTHTFADWVDVTNFDIRIFAAQPLFLDGASEQVNMLPWRVYNHIYNRFFLPESRQSSQATRSNTAILFTSMASRAFQYSLLQYQDNTSEDITGASTVDELRLAVAKDNFNKLRDYYGEKYVDYLRAVGVHSNWTIPEDPELIGKSSCQLQFREIPMSNFESTSTIPLGVRGGR